MKSSPLPFAAAFALGSLIACTPPAELVKIDPAALRPPVLTELAMRGSRSLSVSFDKPAWYQRESCRIAPAGGISAWDEGRGDTGLTLDFDAVPGERYLLEAVVRDEHGNSMNFLHEFFGFNPDPPRLVLNEFVTSYSTTVPTQVELFVLRGGNMAGITLFEGTRSFPEKQLTFPPFRVADGDYVLVHFKPEGLPGEIDETTDKAAASGKGASPTAFDFWAAGTGNLSSDNEVLTVYTNPAGALMDGLMYSSKTWIEGDRYAGFGTKAMLDKAGELASSGGWRIAHPSPRPDDAINPRGATSRRSICRGSLSSDADCAADWHIVPSGESSFGARNSDSVYLP